MKYPIANIDLWGLQQVNSVTAAAILEGMYPEKANGLTQKAIVNEADAGGGLAVVALFFVPDPSDIVIAGIAATRYGGAIVKGVSKFADEIVDGIKGFFKSSSKVKDPGLGNQFKDKSLDEVNEAMQKHVKSGKLEEKYTDPVSGSKSYKNTETGYSYNVDSGKSGQKVEPAHIDVNYPKPKPKDIPKKKLPIKE